MDSCPIVPLLDGFWSSTVSYVSAASFVDKYSSQCESKWQEGMNLVKWLPLTLRYKTLATVHLEGSHSPCPVEFQHSDT